MGGWGGHLGGCGCPLLGSSSHMSCLIQKRGDSQVPWQDYLPERNKADSVSLAFSHFGRRMFGDDTNHDVGNDSDNV